MKRNMADRPEELLLKIVCTDGEVFLVKGPAFECFQLFRDIYHDGYVQDFVQVNLPKEKMKMIGTLVNPLLNVKRDRALLTDIMNRQAELLSALEYLGLTELGSRFLTDRSRHIRLKLRLDTVKCFECKDIYLIDQMKEDSLCHPCYIRAKCQSQKMERENKKIERATDLLARGFVRCTHCFKNLTKVHPIRNPNGVCFKCRRAPQMP